MADREALSVLVDRIVNGTGEPVLLRWRTSSPTIQAQSPKNAGL
jgi:hypothetical protein